jgi:hypothetical protein
MSKQKNVSLGHFTGTGRTLKDARADLEQQLEAAITGDYTPEIIRWRKQTIIVYRDPQFGWVHRRIDYAYNGHSSSGWDDDREEAISQAAYNVVQNQWTPEDGIDAPAIMVEYCPEHLVQEFESWAQWQLYAAEGRDIHGLTDHNDIHAYACARQNNGHYIGQLSPAASQALNSG